MKRTDMTMKQLEDLRADMLKEGKAYSDKSHEVREGDEEYADRLMAKACKINRSIGNVEKLIKKKEVQLKCSNLITEFNNSDNRTVAQYNVLEEEIVNATIKEVRLEEDEVEEEDEIQLALDAIKRSAKKITETIKKSEETRRTMSLVIEKKKEGLFSSLYNSIMGNRLSLS